MIPLFGVMFFGWGLFPILGGGFLVEILGTPVAALVLLVVLKPAIDLRAHPKEHHKAERRLDEAPTNDWSAWTETKR